MIYKLLNKAFIFTIGIFFLIACSSSNSCAQSSLTFAITGNALPGQTVTLSLSLLSDTDISAVSTDITYDSSLLSNPSVIIGVAGTAAGKSVVSSEVDGDTFRVGLISFSNNTAIGDGVVAEISFTVSGAATPGSQTSLTQSASGSDPAGGEVSVTGTTANVSITGSDGYQVLGKITTDIAGHSGLSVNNATIKLFELDKTTTSNTAGEFSFTGVPNGSHHIQVSAPVFYNVKQTINVSGQNVSLDLKMTAFGDVNGDGCKGLAEAIDALQTVSQVQ